MMLIYKNQQLIVVLVKSIICPAVKNNRARITKLAMLQNKLKAFFLSGDISTLNLKNTVFNN